MKILAIETTGKYGSAALIDEDGRLYYADTHDGLEHLRELISTIDNTLSMAGCSKDDVTHVAASVGPGSFTGIRIGVTAARVFAQIKDIPCIAVSSLEAMAQRASCYAAERGVDMIVPVINARRHQAYAGVWRVKSSGDEGRDPEIIPAREERQYMIEELLGIIRDEISGDAGKTRETAKVCFTGDGIDVYEDIIRESMSGDSFIFAGKDIRYQHASSIAQIALEKAAAGELLTYGELLPKYMRLAEAEQKLKAGTLSSKIKMITNDKNDK